MDEINETTLRDHRVMRLAAVLGGEGVMFAEGGTVGHDGRDVRWTVARDGHVEIMIREAGEDVLSATVRPGGQTSVRKVGRFVYDHHTSQAAKGIRAVTGDDSAAWEIRTDPDPVVEGRWAAQRLAYL